MRRTLAAATLLLLAVPALADDTERFSLTIDTGRFGIMMEQSRALIAATPMTPYRSPDTPEQERAAIFERLVSAVLDYNVLSHQACRDGLVAGELCPGPFTPAWLGAKATDFSDTQLRTMADDTGGRLMPFWGALCDKAPRPAAGEFVCPME